MIFPLLQDLADALAAMPREHPRHRILKLLDEAIRRDVHFIDRHPTTFFQCMWNTCWWYDRQESAAPNQPQKVPTAQNELHRLAERFWEMKEHCQPGFVWARVLMSPSVKLGAGLLAILRGHESSVSCVRYSLDGRQIVTGSWDKTLRIWDARSGEVLQVLRGHENAVTSLALFPDGRRLASASLDQSVRVWDLVTGMELQAFHGHEGSVECVACSPDGRWIASGTENKVVQLWDVANEECRSVFRGHELAVKSVTFTPDARRIITGSRDKTIRIWDIDHAVPVRVLTNHDGAVASVACSLDGSLIASGSHDKTVRIWDVERGVETAVLRGHDGAVSGVAFSTDGSRIASSSWDKTVRAWDIVRGTAHAVLIDHDKSIGCVAFSPDGLRLASGSDDQTVREWRLDGIHALTRNIRGHEADSVSFGPDGVVQAHSISEGVDTSIRPKDVPVRCPSGNDIVRLSFSNEVTVTDSNTGRTKITLCGHEGPVRFVIYSPDGRRIVTTSWDATVRVWDAQKGTELEIMRYGLSAAMCLAFSPDGNRLAIALDDKTVRIRELDRVAEETKLSGHPERVVSMAYSPDGLFLACGQSNNSIWVWGTDTWTCHETLQARTGCNADDPAFSAEVMAVAAGKRPFPARAMIRGLETVIEDGIDGQVIVHHSVALSSLSAHPTLPWWAGIAGKIVYVIALEGDCAAMRRAAQMDIAKEGMRHAEQSAAQQRRESEHRQREGERQAAAELQVARAALAECLPDAAPKLEGYALSLHVIRSAAHGGDYFDYFRLDDHRLLMAIGQVCSHGLVAIKRIHRLMSCVRSAVQSKARLPELLGHINRTVSEPGWEDQFATFLVLLLDNESHHLHVASAGHPLPMIHHRGKSVLEELGDTAHGMPLNVFEDAVFQEVIIQLQLGSTILAYSNGIVDYRPPGSPAFGNAALKRCLVEGGDDPWKIGDEIVRQIECLGDTDTTDDVVLFCLARQQSPETCP